MRKTMSFLLTFCMIFPLFCFGAPGAKVKALGENLALGKTSYASSEDDNKKEGAFDGSMGTRWSSAAETDVSGNLTLQNAYIEVDFGEAITFDSIVINECTNWGKMKSYSAQYYLEGQGWRECYAGGPTTTDEVLTFPTVVGSRFRLTNFEMESGITVTIWEIGVYCTSEQLSANLSVSSANASSVTLTWDGDGYELCELISGQSYGAATSPYTVDGLSPGQDLAFVLKKDGKQTAPLSTQTLTNLAAQKSYSGTGTVQNAFDGNPGTAWSAGSETDYLEVNFGTPLTFNRVVASGLTADSVTISCADEADNWTICYIGSAAGGEEIVLSRNFTANKIKLSNITPAGASVSELAVYNNSAQSAPQNLAAGKTYDQSSQEGDNMKAFAAFDGDRTTRFSSDFVSNIGTLAGTWLSVDFGGPVTANTLYIDECTWYSNHIDDFTVQINEGGQWQDLYHGTTVGEYAKIDIPEFTSDKLRILINAATGSTVTIWEVRVTFEESYLRNATYHSSSYEADDKTAAAAFDGSGSTRFSTAINDTVNTWLSVDFGREVTLNKLYIDECLDWGNHVDGFLVQIMQGGDWATVYTGTNIGRNAEITIPMVTTSQLRLYFTAATGVTVTLWEVSFGLNCTEAKNLAAGKTGTASSGDAASAFDGSMTTSWQANASDAQPWLVLDLGVNRSFNCMVLEEDNSAGAITSYELQKKTYSGWESFYGGGTIASGERLFFVPQSTSQVRLLVTGKTGSVGIKEMRVYNDGNARTPDVLGDGWFRLPFAPAADDICGKAIYLLGGYNTIDHGRINSIWGANTPHETLFIGDKAGDVVITFQSGAEKRVPLIFGYTMWFYENWNASKGPVVTENGPQPCADTLQKSLYLQGGFEGQKQGVLKIAIPDGEAVKSIQIEDNPEKFGAPIFTGGYITSEERPGTLTGGETINVDNNFFDSHTVDINDPYNEDMQQKVYATSKIFYNDEADFQSAPPFAFPEGYNGYKITFSGTPFANIATGALYENVQNLSVRVDPDGFIRTSAKGAPNWWYDGFGAYILSAGTYADHCWSRDGSRGILSLVASGNIEPAERALGYIHKWTMYFPENNLTINGKAIPGHCTTVVNQPFFGADSAEAGTLGYPSRYTRELFGDDFKNIGNMEPDGQGLMMMATYAVWKAKGGTADWVEKNWKYINEAGKWIVWNLDNPDVSFSKDDLLYGECEPAHGEWNLYPNVACYLGLRMHVEMARAAGKTAEADLWEAYADRLEAAISNITDAEGRWDASRFGYYRDPVTTFCSDYYGFDVASFMPAEWLERSKNTFVYDMTRPDSSLHGTHFGIAMGYDHNMACQNALLFDEMGEATQFVENLARAHYAPRLPGVYTTPESISVDVERGIVRRQGDLGNLVQMSESIKTLFMTAGVSPLRTDTLTLIPRLPEDWNVDVADYTIPYSTTKLNFHADYPDENGQTASFTIDNASQVKKLRFRAGPFPAETTVANAVVNKNIVPLTLFSSGDSKWAWLELNAPSANTKYNVQIYLTDDIPQQTFTVTFMDRDSQIAKVENVSEGQTVSLPEEPTRRGYTFLGWFTGADGTGSEFTENTPVTGDITVYAKWGRTPSDPSDPEGGSTVNPGKDKDKDKNDTGIAFGGSPAVVYHEPYLSGFTDGTFRPDDNMTRAQAAVIFARLTKGYNENTAYPAAFSDVASGAWYENAANFMAATGTMNGVDGAFLPEGLITRAQLCAMACRYLGLSASGEASFDDCNGHWASGYINVLHQKGMVQGVSEGVFGPDEPVTRAQAVTLLNAVLGRKPVASKITATCPYTDLPASHWAYSDILEASVRHSKTQFH